MKNRFHRINKANSNAYLTVELLDNGQAIVHTSKHERDYRQHTTTLANAREMYAAFRKACKGGYLLDSWQNPAF